MSKSRAKGTSFETDVVKYLRTHGFFDAVRTGSADYAGGDIAGLPLVIECKNQAKMSLAAWVDQAWTAGDKLGRLWAVVHKRVRSGTHKAYFTTDLETAVPMMKALQYCREQKINLD